MAIIDRVKWADQPGNQLLVQYCMIKAAVDILGEAYGGGGQPTTAEHALRIAYAGEVLAGNADVWRYALAVSSDWAVGPAIDNDTEPTDAQLQAAVNSLFSDFAGYDEG